MNLNLSFRQSEPDDAEAIRRVARSSWHAVYDDILGEDTVDRMVDEWYGVDSLRTAIEGSIFYIAEVDREVVGFANAGANPEYGEGTFELYRIYVLPEYWHQRIGGHLLELVSADVKEEGGERLRLSVLSENDVGREFYESRGFERLQEGEIELVGKAYPEIEYATDL